MINVLFIHQSAELYGSDKTILLLVKNLDKSKINPLVVLPSEGPLKEELEKLNINVEVAPVLKLYRDLFKLKNIIRFVKDYWIGFKKINSLQKKYNFDIVYSNTLAVLLGFLASKCFKIPHIWHVHEIIESSSFIKSFYKLLLNNKTNNLVIFNSNATQEFWNIKLKNDVVWNGVETYSDVVYEKKQEENIKIALVGRISRWKGQQLLLDAFHNVQKKEPNLELLFVGSVPPNQEHFLIDLQDKISGLNLDDKVKIIPFQKDIEAVWKSIDIAVVPSTEPEPFGLVAIEAMMSGKPVVGANHGGLKEIIIHNETGLLFEPNNQKELEFCLERLIYNKQLRKEFGTNGLERAKTFFSLENYVKTIEELLVRV